MKRIKFLGIVLLLVCVMVLSGCTKSSTAKIETCNTLYEKVTKNYYRDERTEVIRVFDTEGNVDLYSNNSWKYYESSSPLRTYNYIATVNAEGSEYVLNLLRENGEYAVLVKAVSDFYLLNNKSNHTSKDEDVPQELKSKLYDRIDELGGVLNKVKFSKEVLKERIDDYASTDAFPVEQAIKSFLDNYMALIEKFYEISSIYENIYSDYLYPVNTKTQIPIGGMERLIRGSEIYLAKYYYLKHFVLNGNNDRFSFEKIYNNETSQFVENPTYDVNFKKLVEMVNTAIGEVAVPTAESDEEDITAYRDKVFYYGCCLAKYKSLKTNLNNYEAAVKYIAGLKGKTAGNKLAEEYLKFMEDFDQQVYDYQEYLFTNLIV
ncbi:MAG: hypothetical protein IKR12_02210 [Clostridia bacterium]|nr:hypothetical protein [Clostridia bacterium]